MRCTLTSAKAGLHQCDMTCQAHLIKFIDHQPLTDGFMGFGSMTQVTTTTEEFLPSIFRFIYADVKSVDIKLNQMNNISITVKFRLHGSPTLSSQVYTKEHWKTMHLIKALEDNQITDIKNPVPLLIIRPQKWLRIAPETLHLDIGGISHLAALTDRHELVGTPLSDPPPRQPHYGSKSELRGTYSYYGGRLNAIYGPLVFNEDYTLSFDIEAVNPLYTIDFLFPYQYVDVENISVKTAVGKGILAARPVYAIAEPMVSDRLTPQYEYKINRADGEYPEFEKAAPFRDSPPIAGPIKLDFNKINSATNYPISLDGYHLISVQFQFAFISSQLPNGLIVQAKVTDRAIPIRTYEQMQRLPEYRDFLIQFDIFNTDRNKDRVLEVESEIIGYTERSLQRIIVPQLSGGKGAARKVIEQCPPLKAGILEAMIGPMDASLAYRIYEIGNDDRVLVASGNKTVRLLSNEQIIWSLKDVTSGANYNLEPTLASWVEPYDDNGKLEEVRIAANAFHPGGQLRGNKDGKATLAEQTQDIKALYDCLNQKYGITYGEHPFNYGFQYNDPLTSQRILRAVQVLDARTGVCIDFVILFASLMEGIGINPLLIIDEKHAFLGWGNYKGREAKIQDMGFLETILLGQKDKEGALLDFDVAEKSARKYFRDNFMFTDDDSVRMGFLTRLGKVLVDLEDARKEGAIKKAD